MTFYVATNGHTRNFISGSNIPDAFHRVYYHLTGTQRRDGWIKYKNRYYHISQFIEIDSSHELADEWEAYFKLNNKTGIVIETENDSDQFIIGTYHKLNRGK